MTIESKNPPSSRHFHLERLAEGVYAALAIDGAGARCNAGIVELGGRTLIFDTFLTPQAARDLRSVAEQLTGQPVNTIINSHYNTDHVYGNQVFEPAATIISTARTRELIAERCAESLAWDRENLADEIRADEELLARETDERRRRALAAGIALSRELLAALPELELRLPNLTFERHLTLYGTRRSVEVISLGGGHTPSDAFMYLPEERILFAGDLLFTQIHPLLWHDRPQEWISILTQMEGFDSAVVVPGHGPLSTREDLALQRQYLSHLLELASAVVARGGSEDEAAQTAIPAPYADWGEADRFERNMRILHQILSSEKQ